MFYVFRADIGIAVDKFTALWIVSLISHNFCCALPGLARFSRFSTTIFNLSTSLIIVSIYFALSLPFNSSDKSWARPFIAPRGFLISCATPAAIPPRLASLSALCNWLWISFILVRSLKFTTMPVTAPSLSLRRDVVAPKETLLLSFVVIFISLDEYTILSLNESLI